ncbi:hypothetical protein NECAME_16432 [Necator americanus]|uniref:Uncharacterized protein n=1 Tax=Necator americanus TaxID=51031 RepID=W2TZ34_NECAM|nr:hypothetical protein NECAME_16432 [Necator americanus]ETN86282.1 hypothetical protein NECAME_16432 [Necator americanus]
MDIMFQARRVCDSRRNFVFCVSNGRFPLLVADTVLFDDFDYVKSRVTGCLAYLKSTEFLVLPAGQGGQAFPVVLRLPVDQALP